MLKAWLMLLSLQGITGADYLHGQTQFERMLQDRPVLARHLQDRDPLRTWTVAQLAGARTGFRIYWDPSPPPDGVDAQHRQPVSGQPAILLHPRHQSGPKAGKLKSFADQWADLVFELNNIAQSPAFSLAYDQALSGRLDYHGWLEAVTRAEHQALLETADFHRTRWRAWMRSRGLDPDSRRWRLIRKVTPHYSHWIGQFTDINDYPYSSYGRWFRRQVMPYLRAQGLDWNADPFRMTDLPLSSRGGTGPESDRGDSTSSP